VLGTDDQGRSALYIVDDHHTLCALDFSGFSSVNMTLNVLCDLRALEPAAFWEMLTRDNLALLLLHPIGQPNALPVRTAFPAFPASDDPVSNRKRRCTFRTI
jgi:hypothetical protein